VLTQWVATARAATTAFLQAYWRWLILIAIILIAIWLLWWQVPKSQVHGLHIYGRDRGEIEDNFRKTITQLLGGLVVLAGAGFTYWQFRQPQRSNQALLFSNQIS